jgi:hypothetical protein
MITSPGAKHLQRQGDLDGLRQRESTCTSLLPLAERFQLSAADWQGR